MKIKNNQDIWPHLQIAGISIFVSATAVTFMTGYFREIGFSEMQIAIYGSAIGCAGFFNIFGSWFAQKTGNYKKTLISIMTISVLCFIVGVVTAYLLHDMLFIIPYLVLILMLLWQMGIYMTSPVLLSWFHGIIGENRWPKFFSTRMIISDACVMITALVVGFYLGNAPKAENFLVVFAIGSFFALLSIYFIRKFPNTKEKPKSSENFIKKIASILKHKNFKRLLLVIFIRAFAYGMIMPFQPVFLLEKLKLDYIAVSIMIALGTCCAIMAYKLWAFMQRKHGNSPCMKLCLSLSLIDPFLWIVAVPNNIVTIYASFILFGLAGNQGIINAGYLTSCIGMTFEQSDEESKSIHTSMFFLVVGLAVTIAPIVGGLIIRYCKINVLLFHIQLDSYRFLFAIAAALLMLALGFSFVGHHSDKSTKKQKDIELKERCK